ncbi:MAG: 4Fe-4S dicluster domain-containing protein [Desulfobacterota bacterium]|nr:4Fe-4S dicluster domain-containing protein [Thermodesulfobacteriota bacterium]
MPYRVILQREKCRGCEACVEICTVRVFEVKEGRAIPVREEDCVGCRSCVEVCKEGALAMKEVQPELSETAQRLLAKLFSD